MAIINETTARMFWPGEDPVGKRFKHRLNPNFYTVVGLARDAKYAQSRIGNAATSLLRGAPVLHAGHEPSLSERLEIRNPCCLPRFR